MIIAILGGGDWADASADFVVFEKEINLEEEKKKYNIWYKTKYLPKMSKTAFMSFSAWLLAQGGREPNENELEIFWDN